jgi:hypothetical protein
MTLETPDAKNAQSRSIDPLEIIHGGDSFRYPWEGQANGA